MKPTPLHPDDLSPEGDTSDAKAELEQFLLDAVASCALLVSWPAGEVLEILHPESVHFGFGAADWKAHDFFRRQIHPEDWAKLADLGQVLPFMPGLDSEFRLIDAEGRTVEVRARSRLRMTDPQALMVILQEVARAAPLVASGALSEPWETIFAKAPMPQFCADFSAVRALLQTWQETGVRDFEEFFQGNPAQLRECVARIKLLSANKAATRLFDSEAERDLLDTFHRLSNPLSFRLFGLAVRGLAEGKDSFEESLGSYADASLRRELGMKLQLLPGYEGSWGQVAIWILENHHSNEQVSNRIVEEKDGGESLYRQMFETSPTVLLVLDPDSGRVIECNPAAAHFFGQPRHQLKLLNISQLVATPSEGVFQEMAQVKATARPCRGLRLVARKSQGELQDIELNLAPISFSSRVLLACSILSAAELNRTEDALLKASRMEATSTLAGGIAHDFNNLMAVVLGNASLLCQGAESSEPERQKMLAEIVTIAEKAGKLAQQLLSFARGGKYTPEAVNLNRAVERAVQLQSHSLPDRIGMEFDFQEPLPPMLADPTQLEQVIINLCINARESINGKGNIRISTRSVMVDELFARPEEGFPPGPYLCLSIQDTGMGMSPETRSRIFEPYFSTKSRGRGLGMAAVYGIVKNHLGHIFVLSEPGKGSTFTIYLPVHQGPMPVSTIPEGMEGRPSLSNRVLLIDDDEMVVSVSRRMLQHLGYDVTIARNGQEAVNIARSDAPAFDVAMLDMGMPVMDGYQAFPLLRAARPDMKIIICTGYHLDAVSQQLLGNGAHGFLRKPFNLETLKQKLLRVRTSPGT
jgi:PAS domain S-box-containing protein